MARSTRYESSAQRSRDETISKEVEALAQLVVTVYEAGGARFPFEVPHAVTVSFGFASGSIRTPKRI